MVIVEGVSRIERNTQAWFCACIEHSSREGPLFSPIRQEYAESAMNELLGWYGYGKIDRSDIVKNAGRIKPPAESMNDNNSLQTTISNSTVFSGRCAKATFDDTDYTATSPETPHTRTNVAVTTVTGGSSTVATAAEKTGKSPMQSEIQIVFFFCFFFFYYLHLGAGSWNRNDVNQMDNDCEWQREKTTNRFTVTHRRFRCDILDVESANEQTIEKKATTTYLKDLS